MNKIALILAGVFLAIALIVPPFVLITKSDADLDNLVNQGPNLADETQAQGFLADVDAGNSAAFTIALVVEVISVILFVVCLWFVLKS
jgi:hypothetical protein